MPILKLAHRELNIRINVSSNSIGEGGGGEEDHGKILGISVKRVPAGNECVAYAKPKRKVAEEPFSVGNNSYKRAGIRYKWRYFPDQQKCKGFPPL